MDDAKYHFFRKKPGLAPTWASTRRDRSGTMFEWIRDLQKKFDVIELDDRNFLIADRIKRADDSLPGSAPLSTTDALKSLSADSSHG